MEDRRPVLGYYKLRGWAGPIRLLLAYLEIDYLDKLYPVPSPQESTDQWRQEKNKLGLNFPNLPYWIDGSVKLTETKCILKHIARQTDVRLPIKEEGLANMLEEVLWNLWIDLTNTARDHTEESKREFLVRASNIIQKLDRFLIKKMWAVGSQITYVDFLLYEVLIHLQKFEPNLLDPYSNCLSFLKNFENIPTINKYIKSKNYISGPCYSYKFKSKL